MKIINNSNLKYRKLIFPILIIASLVFVIPKILDSISPSRQPFVVKTLEHDRFVYQATSEKFIISVGENGATSTRQVVRIEKGDLSFDIRLVGGSSSKTTGSESGDSVSFSDVRSDTDLTYELQKGHILQTLVLKSAQADGSFSFILNSNNISSSLDKFRRLWTIKQDGKSIMEIPSAVSVSPDGKASIQIVPHEDTESEMVLTLDKDLLVNPKAKFPMTITLDFTLL